MSPHYIDRIAKTLLGVIGLEVRRRRPSRQQVHLGKMLETHSTDLVLDVGANTGQFARKLRRCGFLGRIVSFEPLASAHRALEAASRHDPQWVAAGRAAIGNDTCEIEMLVSQNSVSSSLLEMLPSHVDAAPDSQYSSLERVQMLPLDDAAGPHLQGARNIFLKIDTQGSEDRVLDGARSILGKARGVQLELSLVPLYAGQKLFRTLDRRLTELGFELWALDPVFSDPKTGRMLQVDATYFRD